MLNNPLISSPLSPSRGVGPQGELNMHPGVIALLPLQPLTLSLHQNNRLATVSQPLTLKWCLRLGTVMKSPPAKGPLVCCLWRGSLFNLKLLCLITVPTLGTFGCSTGALPYPHTHQTSSPLSLLSLPLSQNAITSTTTPFIFLSLCLFLWPRMWSQCNARDLINQQLPPPNTAISERGSQLFIHA